MSGNHLKLYRLGDMIKYRTHRNNKSFGALYHIKNFPNSIVTEYILKTRNLKGSKSNRYSVLHKIVKSRTTPQLIPNENTLVIHLRIGDVIDDSKSSVDEMLTTYKIYTINERKWKGINYARPFSYYKNIITNIKNLPIYNIILIGGYHIAGDHSKSEEYVNKIKLFFEQHNYNVDTRINNDPDEDFIFMSNSTYFVESGGGYSELISKMVERNKKYVIK